jgi:hypothetical protein
MCLAVGDEWLGYVALGCAALGVVLPQGRCIAGHNTARTHTQTIAPCMVAAVQPRRRLAGRHGLDRPTSDDLETQHAPAEAALPHHTHLLVVTSNGRTRC